MLIILIALVLYNSTKTDEITYDFSSDDNEDADADMDTENETDVDNDTPEVNVPNHNESPKEN